MGAPAKTQQQGEQQPKESPMVAFRKQLEGKLDSFAEALPEHVTPQRFKSIVAWAVMADPNLLVADRISLFEACLAAANDGLLPDKKEGALVVYNTKAPKQSRNDPDVWIKKVQWMPMIRGVLTKLYNTGKVKSATVNVVYEGDHFRAWTDDNGEHVEYEEGEKQDRNVVRRIYAAVFMKDGGVFVETMRADDIEKIRSKSKSKDSGPWVDWWEEMAKKSVFRRLAKRLPMARDIMPILERDDALYDLDLRANPAAIAGRRDAPKSLTHRLDDLAAGVPMTAGAQDADYADAGEPAKEDAKPRQAKKQNTAATNEDTASSGAAGDEGGKAADPDPVPGSAADKSGKTLSPVEAAFAAGQKAKADGKLPSAVPAEYRKDDKLLEAFTNGFNAPGDDG